MAYTPKRSSRPSRTPKDHEGASSRSKKSEEAAPRDWSARIGRNAANETSSSELKKGRKKPETGTSAKKFASKNTENKPTYRKKSDSRIGKSKVKGYRDTEFSSKGRKRSNNSERSGANDKPTGRKTGLNADFKPKEFKRNTEKNEERTTKRTRFSTSTSKSTSGNFSERSESQNTAKAYSASRVYKKTTDKKGETTTLVRLNKFIANAGICSRREADQIIEEGWIKVNDLIVNTLGSKIDPTKDKVTYKGKVLKAEVLRYILLNKPKDFITTTEDPHERNTVMQLISQACTERVLPVGRLDRNTTGLLLFTNDGDLAKLLTHPSHGVKKLYQVTLDRPITKSDMQKIADGLELEDGKAYVDTIAYVADEKDTVGLEIHIGRNRIVRRIFEALGYKVMRLDRVMFGILTKKDLPRGSWRHLTEKEVQNLKNLSRKKGSKKQDHQLQADAFLADLDN